MLKELTDLKMVLAMNAADRRNFLNSTSLWKKVVVLALFSPAALALCQTGGTCLKAIFNDSVMQGKSCSRILGNNIGRNYSWLFVGTAGAAWDFVAGAWEGALPGNSDKPSTPQP